MHATRASIFAVVLLGSACHRTPAVHPLDPTGPAIPARVAADFPAAWPFRPGAKASFAQHGMVSSNERLAS
jgi:hypothetical protein